MWSLVKRALTAIAHPLWTEGKTAVLGAAGQSYCVWCFLLHQEQKSDLHLFSHRQNVSTRRHLFAALYRQCYPC